VAFSHDGRWLAIARGQLELWDVATGAQLAAAYPMWGGVNAVAFAPDDRWLAVVGAGMQSWDITTRQGKPALTPRRELMGHLSEVYSVDISPDGKWLVTTSRDDSFKVWDAATGRQLAAWLSPKGVAEAVFSPDGKTLAIVGSSHAGGAKIVAVLMLWPLDDLLAPERVKARAQAAVAELFRLVGAGQQREAFRQLAALGPDPETTVPLLMQKFRSHEPLTREAALTALSMEGEAARPFLPEIRALLGNAAEMGPALESLRRIEGRKP
jgi:hypothetical protein